MHPSRHRIEHERNIARLRRRVCGKRARARPRPHQFHATAGCAVTTDRRLIVGRISSASRRRRGCRLAGEGASSPARIPVARSGRVVRRAARSEDPLAAQEPPRRAAMPPITRRRETIVRTPARHDAWNLTGALTREGPRGCPNGASTRRSRVRDRPLAAPRHWSSPVAGRPVRRASREGPEVGRTCESRRLPPRGRDQSGGGSQRQHTDRETRMATEAR
jgi:hypothetical protein